MSLSTEHRQGRMIIYSEFNAQKNPHLHAIITDDRLDHLIERTPEDTIIVLGGDGTLLEAIGQFYGEKKPFLGINYGTKGFLMNPISILDTRGEFRETLYPILEGTMGTHQFYAFNELDIKAGDGKMLTTDITLLPNHILSISGDGIIVSTPMGSTGYNAALGGPILPHGTNAYIITPKAPWKPRWQPPVIISGEDTIDITLAGRKTPVEIYADGHRIDPTIDINQTFLRICQIPDAIRLLTDEDDQDHWKEKVLIEQGFSTL